MWIVCICKNTNLKKTIWSENKLSTVYTAGVNVFFFLVAYFLRKYFIFLSGSTNVTDFRSNNRYECWSRKTKKDKNVFISWLCYCFKSFWVLTANRRICTNHWHVYTFLVYLHTSVYTVTRRKTLVDFVGRFPVRTEKQIANVYLCTRKKLRKITTTKSNLGLVRFFPKFLFLFLCLFFDYYS